MHRVLEQFIATLPDGRLSTATASARSDTLMQIAGEELDAAERLGLTGAPLLWSADRTEILEDLARWLDHELADGGGYAQHAVEVAFGGRRHGDGASPLDTDDFLELPAGSRTAGVRPVRARSRLARAASRGADRRSRC